MAIIEKRIFDIYHFLSNVDYVYCRLTQYDASYTYSWTLINCKIANPDKRLSNAHQIDMTLKINLQKLYFFDYKTYIRPTYWTDDIHFQMAYTSWKIAVKNWNLLWHSGKHNWNDIQYTWYIDSIDLNGSSEYQTQSFSLYKKTLLYEPLISKRRALYILE